MLCEAYWHEPHGGEEYSNKKQKKYDFKQEKRGRHFRSMLRIVWQQSCEKTILFWETYSVDIFVSKVHNNFRIYIFLPKENEE
jgi:hypothetical protein